MNSISHKRNFAAHGWFGIFLIVVFWILNWSLHGLRTHWGFFPLWLGYCLTVDALVLKRTGSSLYNRSIKKYFLLFVVSAPCWWLFELFNSHLQNWQYLGKENFSTLEYAFFETISFSTVTPAVIGSAELVSTFAWVKRFNFQYRISSNSKTAGIFFTFGLLLLAGILNWPTVFYPFVWIAVFLLIEPINLRLGYSSLLNFTSNKNWLPMLSLILGCLICAFFWEMWNYFSYPKWIYHLPHVDAPKLFEMPLPGYIGYIPFSLEVFAMTSLLFGLMKLKLSEYLLPI